MLTRIGLIAAFIVPGLIACEYLGSSEDAPSSEPVGVSLEPIIGGVPATGYPEAALLDMHDASGGSWACSASLIAPKVVLTAGHCVDGMTSFDVYVGTTKRPAVGSEVYDWHENGATTVNPNHHDIGLVYLQDAITLSSYPTLALSPVANGTRVLNVGRILNNKLTSSLYQAGTNVTNASTLGFPYDYYSPDIIEHGDSGGPVFADGTHTIVAVNSGAGNGTQVLARVDLVNAWLKDRIAQKGGTASPQGTGGAASSLATGGKSSTGGALATGGKPSTGGALATGGKATGGAVPTGGKPSTGGALATGGKATGGAVPTGGKPSTGGALATGGKATGGKPSTGGALATGGKATGGAVPTGGKPSTSGASSVVCVNEVEPNNDFAHATALTTSNCGSLSSTSDLDWYRFTVASTVKMITLTADRDATFGIGYVIGGSCSIALNGLRQIQVQAVGASANLCVVVSSPGKVIQSYKISMTP